jgi:hypothetical protein
VALWLSVASVIGFAPVAHGKPGPDGIPAWMSASERGTIAQVFGNAHPVLISHIPYPLKIAVVFEFQSIVVCRTCSAPSNLSRPHGRVVRVSFDRRTHLPTGAMRFCEVHGVTPPLSACLAR